MHRVLPTQATFLLTLFACFLSFSIEAQEKLKPAPLGCPQCGIWQISSSNPHFFVSDLVLVDAERVLIRGCGTFFYDLPKIESKLISEHRHEYIVRTSFKGRTSPRITSICGGENEELWTPSEWNLTINVTGHFREGGYADFSLTRNGIRDPILSFRAWNIDREDPCGAGSGFGTGECYLIANGELRNALSGAVDAAEYRLSKNFDSQKNKLFNLTKFLEKADTYCIAREKNSGGGLWPSTWALSCIGEQMAAKLKQFRRWEACAKMASNISKCPFPKDSVSRR